MRGHPELLACHPSLQKQEKGVDFEGSDEVAAPVPQCGRRTTHKSSQVKVKSEDHRMQRFDLLLHILTKNNLRLRGF